MNIKDEALKMAIEALPELISTAQTEYDSQAKAYEGYPNMAYRYIYLKDIADDGTKAINACKEALEQPAFDYNTAFSHGYEAHKSEREYPTKEEMLDKIFEATYQQHNSVKLLHPNEGSIIFSNPTTDWVMRITSDRKIEVNEDVEVTEAAQKVLDAMQPLLDKQQPAQEPAIEQALKEKNHD